VFEAAAATVTATAPSIMTPTHSPPAAEKKARVENVADITPAPSPPAATNTPCVEVVPDVSGPLPPSRRSSRAPKPKSKHVRIFNINGLVELEPPDTSDGYKAWVQQCTLDLWSKEDDADKTRSEAEKYIGFISQARQLAVGMNDMERNYFDSVDRHFIALMHKSVTDRANVFFNEWKGENACFGHGNLLRSCVEDSDTFQCPHVDLLPNNKRDGFLLHFPFPCTSTRYIPYSNTKFYGPTPDPTLDYSQDGTYMHFTDKQAATAIWNRMEYFMHHPVHVLKQAVTAPAVFDSIIICQHDLIHSAQVHVMDNRNDFRGSILGTLVHTTCTTGNSNFTLYISCTHVIGTTQSYYKSGVNWWVITC
jgi:hypothetical protein